MSYEVIARKWRPQAFDEVSGQEHVTAPLRNAIRSDRVPHAILLTGPRGVGKTTLARLLARCLNCEKGPTETPCGVCISCEEITAGRSNDVQEVDAASRTSVDDVRELIESIRYAPSPGKHRIFVVDEVHMLSTAAFNALLKTLEEPPPRSLFVLATTNPEKIPFTVVSRCQRYDLRRIASSEVVDRLRLIASSENVTISDSSLLALAREGEGSMRDSQTLLDQVIAYGGSEVSDETVAQVLDLIDRRVLLAIVRACIEGDPAAALRACADATNKGAEPARLSRDLVMLLRDLVVLKVAGPKAGLVEASAEEIAELEAVGEAAEEARIRRMFRALIQEQEDLAWAPQPMAVLEMALVRLATLPSGDDVGRLLARLDALEKKLRGDGAALGSGGGGPAGGRPSGRGSAPRAPARSEPVDDPSTLRRDTEASALRSPPASARSDAADDRASIAPASTPPASTPPTSASPTSTPSTSPTTPEAPEPDAADPLSAPSPQPSPSPASHDTPLSLVFDRLRSFAQNENRGLYASLEGGRLLERRDGRLRIEVPGSFHSKRLQDRTTDFEAICERFFGEPIRVEFEAGGLPQMSSVPAVTRAPRREEERRRKQEALNHPAINIALEELAGEIIEIKPLGGGS